MKKIFQNLGLIAVFAAVLQLFFPWWIVVIVAAMVSFWADYTPKKAFITSFTAISTLWFFYAMFIDYQTTAILSSKIAAVFTVSTTTLFALTSFIGGFAAGLGGTTGSLFRQVFK
ncbi:MAG: hypothetical protein ACPG5B_10725 [Chitinophagales bacterium]